MTSASVYVYGRTHICNQAFVFAISHSAIESTLPVVVQHQQPGSPTPQTHTRIRTHTFTGTDKGRGNTSPVLSAELHSA